MQDFCPLCSKNGNKVEIKTYQLNSQEAVYMCKSEKCTWPVGYQDIVLLNRTVGKEWSKSWDDAASKHLKNEIDSMLEFLPYTPPQTPGTESNSKDATLIDKSSTVVNRDWTPIAVDNFSDKNSTIVEAGFASSQVDDFINNAVNDANFFSKSGNLPVFDDGFDLNFEPVVSRPAIPVLDVIESNHTFLNNTNDKVLDIQQPSKKFNIEKKSIPSIAKEINPFNQAIQKALHKKNEKSSSSVSLSNIKKPRKLSSFKLLKNKTKSLSYGKFDFDELLKEKKSTKKPDIKIEIVKVEKPNDSLKVASSHDLKECSLNESQALNSKVSKVCSSNELNLTNAVRNSTNDVGNAGKEMNVDVGKSSSEAINTDGQFDFDSFLSTLSPSSKDSEIAAVDPSLLEATESEFNLDDFLADFTTESAVKSGNDSGIMEERKYTDSLFA